MPSLIPYLIIQPNCIHAENRETQINRLSQNHIYSRLLRCQREGLVFDQKSGGI